MGHLGRVKANGGERKKLEPCWVCSSVVEHLLSIGETPGSTPCATNQTKGNLGTGEKTQCVKYLLCKCEGLCSNSQKPCETRHSHAHLESQHSWVRWEAGDRRIPRSLWEVVVCCM